MARSYLDSQKHRQSYLTVDEYYVLIAEHRLPRD
jgi:hypothetical protein